jgi:hypothetical protein
MPPEVWRVESHRCCRRDQRTFCQRRFFSTACIRRPLMDALQQERYSARKTTYRDQRPRPTSSKHRSASTASRQNARNKSTCVSKAWLKSHRWRSSREHHYCKAVSCFSMRCGNQTMMYIQFQLLHSETRNGGVRCDMDR